MAKAAPKSPETPEVKTLPLSPKNRARLADAQKLVIDLESRLQAAVNARQALVETIIEASGAPETAEINLQHGVIAWQDEPKNEKKKGAPKSETADESAGADAEAAE